MSEETKCGASVTAADTGDAYDCVLAKGHAGRHRFSIFPVGRIALMESLSAAEARAKEAEREASAAKTRATGANMLRAAAESSRDRALAALRDAESGLFRAWQMLSAICESDPSRDRTKARDDAAKALAAVRRAVLGEAK